VHETVLPAARTPAHKALGAAVQTYVARLARRVLRAFLDRDRDRLLVSSVGVVLLRAAAALNLGTFLVVVTSTVRVVVQACRTQ